MMMTMNSGPSSKTSCLTRRNTTLERGESVTIDKICPDFQVPYYVDEVGRFLSIVCDVMLRMARTRELRLSRASPASWASFRATFVLFAGFEK